MIPYRNGLTAYTFYGNWAKPERSSSGAEMGESYPPHPLGVSLSLTRAHVQWVLGRN